MSSIDRHPRVLVIDDNPAIHADIRKILCPNVTEAASAVAELEAQLLGESSAPALPRPRFGVESAYQGREGLALVEKAVAESRPYSVAFVDVRMPPGWDGVETTRELWKVAPDLQIVICTAYSDYSWDELLAKIGGTDRLVILKKPFDTIEVLQLANALSEKARLLEETRAHAHRLEERVQARTADLQASNRALQDEIERRATVEADLKRAKEAAESADRAKSAFLANMSHEVRTPMNGVVGMANLLLNTSLTTEQRDFAEVLCRSCDALLTIINDILDFSKIEAGSLQLERIDFDLLDTLGLALDLHADAAAQKHVELVLDVDPAVPRFVAGDPTRLRQIVLNLLANAIKFTARGEVVVTVTAAGLRDDAADLRFEVADTGIGIAEDVQSRLFLPFVQGDVSTTRKYGGTGLGLAICKRLVELMGGEIGVTSQPGRGSTFWFAITVGRAPEADHAAPEPAELAGRRALIVDDNAANRKLLRHLFDAWHLVHGEVEDAAHALTELRRAAAAGQPYDLALLDYHMPGMDGLGLAAAIHADAELPRPRLVLLTSSSERLGAPELVRHGLAACELKPLHADKIRATLGRVMRTVAPAAAHGASAPARAGAAAGGSPSILVAEDNPVNQKVTLLQLRQLGYDADLASNGLDVLAALGHRSYELILMDAQMPQLDGMETTRRIRERERAEGRARVRIIAMTASAMECDRAACLAAGMDDFLPKPVRANLLRTLLEQYVPGAPRAELAPGLRAAP